MAQDTSSPDKRDPLTRLRERIARSHASANTAEIAADTHPLPKAGAQVAKGLLAYLLVLAIAVGWISFHARETVTQRTDRIAAAEARVRIVHNLQQAGGINDLSQGFTAPYAQAPAAQAPAASTTETAATAALPPISSTYDIEDNRPKIALIITGLGPRRDVTEQAISQLPGSVSLAFSPYTAQAGQFNTAALADNHQTLLIVPMEPLQFPQRDPGPLAMFSRQGREENLRSLETMLTTLRGVSGVVNYMGSRFMTDAEKLTSFMENLKSKNLIFIEADPVAASKAGETAAKTGTSFFDPDVIIDETMSEDAAIAQFQTLANAARTRGYAVGVINAYPAGITATKNWIESESRANRISFIPVNILPEVARRAAIAR